MNRGQGIHVVDSIKKCKKLISEYCQGREVGASLMAGAKNKPDMSPTKSKLGRVIAATYGITKLPGEAQQSKGSDNVCSIA